MPYAIARLQAAGYRLVTLAECLGQAPYQFVGAPSTPDVSTCTFFQDACVLITFAASTGKLALLNSCDFKWTSSSSFEIWTEPNSHDFPNSQPTYHLDLNFFIGLRATQRLVTMFRTRNSNFEDYFTFQFPRRIPAQEPFGYLFPTLTWLPQSTYL